jgi:hypothetical protein
MKTLLIAPLLLMLSLVASQATAQTTDRREVERLQQQPVDPSQTHDLESADLVFPADGVRAARSQYTVPDIASPNQDEPLTLAQYSRSGPRGPVPRRAGDPRASYPQMREPSGNGKHALIGALIGFGIGAAVAAKGHASVGATVAFGTLGGAMGAAFGAMGPPVPSRNRYRRPWDDEYVEDARLSSTKSATAKRTAPQAKFPSSTASE